jgi:hypothetical protein
MTRPHAPLEPVLASLAVRETPAPDHRTAQRAAAARIDWADLPPRLEPIVREQGASVADAVDLVHAAAAKPRRSSSRCSRSFDDAPHVFVGRRVVATLEVRVDGAPEGAAHRVRSAITAGSKR